MNTNRAAAVATHKARMSADRKAAIWIGVLYIIGTVGMVLSLVVTSAVLSGPAYLAQVAARPNEVAVGALLLLVAGLSLAMVPVVFWPIGKRYNETLAMGFVVFRGALESVIYIVSALCYLLLIALSTVPDGGALASFVRTSETVIWDQLIAIPFALGALMFYVVLYQSRLVPRWLSTWGLLGAVLYIAAPLGSMFELSLGFFMGPLAQHPGSAQPPHCRAGDGPGGVADREGLQPISDRRRVCRRDVNAAGHFLGVSSVERHHGREGSALLGVGPSR